MKHFNLPMSVMAKCCASGLIMVALGFGKLKAQNVTINPGSGSYATLKVGLYQTLVNSTAYLSIAAVQETKIHLVITDLYGRSLQTHNHMLVTGSNLLNIDAVNLVGGVYNITVYDAANQLGVSGLW